MTTTTELTLRVRELEKGLEDERSQHSSEKHPLLEDHLLSIAAPPTQEDHEAEAEDGPISTFGTLMIAVSFLPPSPCDLLPILK